MSISPLLLVRLSPSWWMCRLVHRLSLLFFYGLGCMQVNWGRLLILLQWAAMLSTASISTCFFRYCSLEADIAMPGGLHARLCHMHFSYFGAVRTDSVKGVRRPRTLIGCKLPRLFAAWADSQTVTDSVHTARRDSTRPWSYFLSGGVNLILVFGEGIVMVSAVSATQTSIVGLIIITTAAYLVV